jgi:hypothetical protein
MKPLFVAALPFFVALLCMGSCQRPNDCYTRNEVVWES